MPPPKDNSKLPGCLGKGCRRIISGAGWADILAVSGVRKKMPGPPRNLAVKNRVFVDMWHGVAQVNSPLNTNASLL